MDLVTFVHALRLRYQDEIVHTMQSLVRIPSQNMPPAGEELACQEWAASYLRRAGLPAELYEPDQTPGLVDHPFYWPGRDYRSRPNLCSTLPGRGGGRSLLLTGHMDTVALGDGSWTYPPFGAEVHGGRLYGLGSVDMKGAMGAMLVLFKAVAEQRIPLRGTLCYESVVDEEEAGVNSTIAGRLRYGPMDGAIIPEVTALQVYPAARGALITHLLFKSTQGTWLEVGTQDAPQADVVRQMGLVLAALPELAARRKQIAVPPLYQGYPEPAPAQVTKVYAGGWGSAVPIAVPQEGHVELILQSLPGEQRAAVLGDLESWLASIVQRHPRDFAIRPQVRFERRWMVPTSMDASHPLVTTLAESVSQVTHQRPAVLGAPYPCDLFALQHIFGMPALVFGPAGANAHAPDEYVEMETVFQFWESLLLFTMQWCGVDSTEWSLP